MRPFIIAAVAALAGCAPPPPPISTAGMSESQLIWYQAAMDACMGQADIYSAGSGLLYGVNYAWEKQKCVEGWQRHGYVANTKFQPYGESRFPNAANQADQQRRQHNRQVMDLASYECDGAKDRGVCSLALAALRGGAPAPANSPTERHAQRCAPLHGPAMLQCLKGPL